MSESLEPKVRETLRNYVREVKSLPNEAAKRSRFAALIGELFPGTNAVTEYSRGVEKLIRINRPTGEKRGRADAYYGNAIIEFEKSLPATLAEAEGQLREYVAGTWQKDKAPRSLLAIASDGINWRLYRPVLPPGEKPDPETVTLDELRDFKVAEDSLGDFWLWITSLLFRAQQIEPTAERFQLDFGTWSPLYREGLAALKRAWAKVSGGSEARLAFDTWQRYLTVTYGRLTEDTTATRDRETAQEISELENLFLRHTYLASIARLVIWAALSQGKGNDDLRKVANDVLSGRYFQSKRLANLVDDDFFHWIRNVDAEKILAPTWERILSHLTEYDLSQVREDVLKGVYQQLIDPKDRHDLGEYYTPDWLCERIVKELLPNHGYDGRIWLRPEGTKYFCGDLSEQEQKLVWATQGVPVPDLFNAKVGGTAWKSKPSWYIVGKNDRTVHPDLERFFAKRMGAITTEVASSHVPMLSRPDVVIDVIRAAANAVQKATAAA